MRFGNEVVVSELVVGRCFWVMVDSNYHSLHSPDICCRVNVLSSLLSSHRNANHSSIIGIELEAYDFEGGDKDMDNQMGTRSIILIKNMTKLTKLKVTTKIT